MDTSFYTAAAGVSTQQQRLNVISNNFANVNTTGYKSKQGRFQELIYYNMRVPQNEDLRIQAGVGVKIGATPVDYAPGGYAPTNSEYDYAIDGDGFFMVQDPVSGEVTYTRDGQFQLSYMGEDSGDLEEYELYLITNDGKRVLDDEGEPFKVKIKIENTDSEDDDDDDEDEDDEDEDEKPVIGVYGFPLQTRMESVGNNQFRPIEGSGEPVLLDSRKKLVNKALEFSNVDFATEMTRMIETQRAYTMALKMVQTSDEMVSAINSLRQG